MLSLLVSAMLQELPEISAIQQQGLAARRAIVSGELEYEVAWGVVSETPLGRPLTDDEWQPPHLRDRLVFVASPEWHTFLERWNPAEPSAVVNGRGEVRRASGGGSRERIIVRPDRVYQFYPDPLSDGTVVGIGENLPLLDKSNAWRVFHPWKFGLIPNFVDAFATHQESDYVAPAVQRKPVIELETLDGAPCWRITYRDQQGWRVRTWFDPERGMNVRMVSVEGFHPANGLSFRMSVSSQLEFHPPEGVWFPVETVLVQEATGPAYKATYERVRFTNVKVQQPIAPEAFTVKALAAPPGTGISRSYHKSGPNEIWDGKDVVPRMSGRAPIRQPGMALRSWRLPLVVVGNLLLLLGIAGWIYLQRKRRFLN